MFEALKSVWNFSKKRQGSLVKILILSFIEGIFVMLKMIAIILAVNAMFNSNLMDNYIYKVMILGIVCIIGVFGFGYFTQLVLYPLDLRWRKIKGYILAHYLKNSI